MFFSLRKFRGSCLDKRLYKLKTARGQYGAPCQYFLYPKQIIFDEQFLGRQCVFFKIEGWAALTKGMQD